MAKYYTVENPTENMIATKTRIFAFINNEHENGDVTVVSVFENVSEGRLEGICNHWSSGVDWAKHDIGVNSDWKHDVYDEKFGKGGWVIEWVGCLETHSVLGKYLDSAGNDKPVGDDLKYLRTLDLGYGKSINESLLNYLKEAEKKE